MVSVAGVQMAESRSGEGTFEVKAGELHPRHRFCRAFPSNNKTGRDVTCA